MSRRQLAIQSRFPEKWDRIMDFIPKAKWREAKSYSASAPHEYCVINTLPIEMRVEFYYFCDFIKEAGIKEYFYRTPYTYLHVGDYKYWTMEKEGEVPILINRALIKHSYDTPKA